MSKFLKPRTLEEAFRVGSPVDSREPRHKEFFYRPGNDKDGYNTYRANVLEHLRNGTQLTFLKNDFLADMQNQKDVDKWLGHVERSTTPTAMCVYNALCQVSRAQYDPSPLGEKFTWEVDYLLNKAFGRNTMLNTTKLFTLNHAIGEVKGNGGTYLAVIFRQAAGKGDGPKVPKKSVVAGGISHMQVWKGPGGGARFEIEDRQSGKEEWVTGDKRVILWKIAD